MCATVLRVFHKLVDLPFLAVFFLQAPEQKRADWISPHYRVEELHDLLRLPDELPLDRREKILPVHSFDGDGDCFGTVAHKICLKFRTFVGSFEGDQAVIAMNPSTPLRIIAISSNPLSKLRG